MRCQQFNFTSSRCPSLLIIMMNAIMESSALSVYLHTRGPVYLLYF